MQTWLDWYVKHACAMTRTADPAVLGGGSDHEMFADMTADAYRLVMSKNPEYEKHEKYDIGWFLTHVAPFAGLYFGKAPFAAQVDAESVRDLRNAPISDDVRDYARNVRDRYRVAYLDVADRAYPLEGGLQLRGLFIFPNGEGEHFCAVFTRPGSNFACRLAWSEGRHARNSEDKDYDQVWSMPSFDCRGDQHFNMREFDYAQLAEIEDFAWLTLTYLETERENGIEMERLPHMPGTDARRSGRKSSQAGKKFSLFSVVRVSTRNLDRDYSEGGRGEGTLHRRHHVKGHFRLQAYGPRWSKRRLRWITAHDRGTGDLSAPIPLHLVRTVNGLVA